MSRFIVIVLLTCLPLVSQAGESERTRTSPSAESMIVDGLVVRPLSLAATAVGTGIFIVTLPFSAAGGNVGEAGNALVKEPARATFGRCLGCLPYGTRYKNDRQADESR